jgi:hypothetical protein
MELARLQLAELADDYGRRTGLAVLPELARVVFSELACFPGSSTPAGRTGTIVL